MAKTLATDGRLWSLVSVHPPEEGKGAGNYEHAHVSTIPLDENESIYAIGHPFGNPKKIEGLPRGSVVVVANGDENGEIMHNSVVSTQTDDLMREDSGSAIYSTKTGYENVVKAIKHSENGKLVHLSALRLSKNHIVDKSVIPHVQARDLTSFSNLVTRLNEITHF